jgi:predicted MFS family arabinose efflux permease
MGPGDNQYVVRDGLPAIATAMVIGTAALMVLGVQPILLAALVAEQKISNAELGRLATAEVLAIAVGAAMGVTLFRAGGMRAKAAITAAILGVINVASCYAAGGAALFLLRGFAGVVEGVLLGSAIVILTRTRSPDRVNGVFLAVQTIPQALAALILPIYLVPRWGSGAGFTILAGLCFLGVVLAPLLPRQGAPASTAAHTRLAWTPEMVCILLAITLQTAGIGAALEYLAQLAAHNGFSQRDVGLATSGNLVLQVVGAFIVVGIAWRIPSALALLVGVSLQAAMALSFPLMPTGGAYVALACFFGLFMLALGPFKVAWLVRIDPTRRIALFILPTVLIGWSFGSFVASFWVTPESSDAAYWTSAGFFLSAGVLYLTVLALGARARKAAAAL